MAKVYDTGLIYSIESTLNQLFQCDVIVHALVSTMGLHKERINSSRRVGVIAVTANICTAVYAFASFC